MRLNSGVKRKRLCVHWSKISQIPQKCEGHLTP
jgi:hypothetical protein